MTVFKPYLLSLFFLPDLLQFIETSDGSLVWVGEVIHVVGFAGGALSRRSIGDGARGAGGRRRNDAVSPLESAGLMEAAWISPSYGAGATRIHGVDGTHAS